jgi:hypothetical protein
VIKTAKDSSLPKASKSIMATYSPSKDSTHGWRVAREEARQVVEARDWGKYGIDTFDKFLNIVKEMNSAEEGNKCSS